MKSIYRTIIAAAGSFLAAQFGGWDAALETLVCFMAIDWITGGVLLPVVFKKSPKSENGTLESRAGWKGLCRKGMMLFFVLVAEKLDRLTQTNYLRDAVCIGFILNEAVSILENAGLMEVKICSADMETGTASQLRCACRKDMITKPHFYIQWNW